MRNLNHLAAILLLCCLLCPLSLNAEKWTAETLPMVYLQDARRHVCNPDGVLDEATVSSTDSLLTALEKDKGVQTVVVAVKQIEGGVPYEFGMSLARKHGIGSAKQNSGLIVVLATEDRAYQILTGTGLEGTLPDAICSRIERRVMVPRLKRGEWGPAISETMKAIDGYIRGDESLTAEEDGDATEAAVAEGVEESTPVGAEEMAQALGYTRAYLCARFREEAGLSLSQYIQQM